MQIHTYPDPVLRKKSKAVLEITPQIKEIFQEMSKTMYLAMGIGLAAPQVGINKQMIILDIGQGLVCLLNPRIVYKSGHSVLEEGCLSFPGISVKVRRWAKVKVEALDSEGRPVTMQGAGLLAHVLQHEIDHLRGRLIIDYANLSERWQLRRKLNDLALKSKQSQNNIKCSIEAKCI